MLAIKLRVTQLNFFPSDSILWAVAVLCVCFLKKEFMLTLPSSTIRRKKRKTMKPYSTYFFLSLKMELSGHRIRFIRSNKKRKKNRNRTRKYFMCGVCFSSLLFEIFFSFRWLAMHLTQSASQLEICPVQYMIYSIWKRKKQWIFFYFSFSLAKLTNETRQN